MARTPAKFDIGDTVYDLSDASRETVGFVRAIVQRANETTYLVAVSGVEAEYHANEITDEKQL